MLYKLFLFAIISSILFSAVSCGICNGIDSRISAPEVSLSELNSGCNSHSRARETSCISAMNQFCSRVTFPSPITTFGISLEVANYRIKMACMESYAVKNVPIEELRAYNGGCNTHRSQNKECLVAMHRYCADKFGENFAGFSQGVGANTLEVHCFESTSIEVIRADVMRRFHSGCNVHAIHGCDCFAAAHRYCRTSFQSNGGMTIDSSSNTITVACYRAMFVRDAIVVRNNDFYTSVSTIEAVCDLQYNLKNGSITKESQELLKSNLFDNSNSTVPLSASFSVSQSVMETSTFSASLTPIGLSTTIMYSGKPTVIGGSLSLTHLLPTNFTTSTTTAETKMYTESSSLTVPPGKSIRREAFITMSTLSVPFTATVRTRMGSMRTVEGTWLGTSANSFRITQEDINN